MADVRTGEFKSKNTLKSKQLPTFSKAQYSRGNIYDAKTFQQSSTSDLSPSELTCYQSLSQRDSYMFQHHQASPNDIGNLSSPFDISPGSLEYTTGIYVQSPTFPTPITTLFGKSRICDQARGPSRTMVNERLPPKAPLQSAVSNEPTQQAEPAQLEKPVYPLSVPKFGQPSLPQSPLSRSTLESKVFIKPKPQRPEYHKQHHDTNNPHLYAAKDIVKGVVDPLLSKTTTTHADPRYCPPNANGTAIPIPRPMDSASFTTTWLSQQQAFGFSGNPHGGFQSINRPTQPTNFINFTGTGYHDLLAPAEPYSFVDPSKAAADIKALLEGAIEDDDDMPKTQLRKKRIAEKADGLVAKLKDLAVTGDAAEVGFEDDADEDEEDGTVEGIKVKLLPHQVEGLSWMKDRELGTRKKGVVPKGGILADDMGLGKTLQSIALILTNPKPKASEIEDDKRKFPSSMEKCTLVVAPLALIRQWELEIKDKVADSHQLRVCVHHGPQRSKRFQDLMKYDVVITTYQILVSEFGGSSSENDGPKIGCFGLHWYRVILDEAHSIKNRNAKATQACYALRSEYRWCLTGTPMQNNLDELQSLIKFLRIKPYDDLKEWRDQIDRPMKNGRGDLAIKRLQHYLRIFMKRRTKDILKKEGALNPGGKASATKNSSVTGFRVTERRVQKVFATFSPTERLFYDRLEQRADRSLEEMLDGEKVNYASALVLLLRLRQACNHPKLVAGKLAKDSEAFGVDAGSRVQTPRKSRVSSADVDEMVDMFDGLGVESKKCDICGSGLSRELARSGAIHCEDCEADLELVEKKRCKKEPRSRGKPIAPPIRQPRNRPVVLDSEDEDEGEWIVGEAHRGSATLGKAGGTDDENAEGEGISIKSDDSHEPDNSDGKYLGSKKIRKKVITIDDSTQADDSDDNSEVEDEFQSSSEEDTKLSTIVASTKINHLLKILGKEAAEHKFIVFSQFTSMLDLIEPFLKRDGYKYTRYDGSMKNDLREASLARLRNEKSCRILLCSLKCGSLGLNLTAATRVVILEPFWNPFVEEQAIDRVHRLTQKIDVVIYKITIENSVEERILELQEKKRELANQAIEGGAKANIGKLGMKEILQLFRRDAEYAPQNASSTNYSMGVKPRVLAGPVLGSGGGNVASSRESPVVITGERRVTPPSNRPVLKEHQIYGRRW